MKDTEKFYSLSNTYSILFSDEASECKDVHLPGDVDAWRCCNCFSSDTTAEVEIMVIIMIIFSSHDTIKSIGTSHNGYSSSNKHHLTQFTK